MYVIRVTKGNHKYYLRGWDKDGIYYRTPTEYFKEFKSVQEFATRKQIRYAVSVLTAKDKKIQKIEVIKYE